jgi:threonine/homoserine/homoserine lactone efflux protein
MKASDNWLMAVIGAVLVIAGFTMTALTGMHGAKPHAPVPLRFRVILISFGMLMIGLGLYRLLTE